MIRRILTFFAVLTVGSYVYQTIGRDAALAAVAALNALLLPLFAIESRLKDIAEGNAKQSAQLTKIIRGYLP